MSNYTINDKNNNYALLGKLYLLLEQYEVLNSHAEFIDFLVDEKNFFLGQENLDKYFRGETNKFPQGNTNLWRFVSQEDSFTKPAIHLVSAHLSDTEKFLSQLNPFLERLSSNDISNIMNALVEALTNYQLNCNNQNDNENSEKKLLTFYSTHSTAPPLAYNIYLFIYFAVYKKLPKNFYYGAGYNRNLEEFNHEITQRYGISTPNGFRAIKYLALEKNNLVALYEYANILYFGKTPSGIPNYAEAYNLLKKSAGLDSTNDINLDSCNPLALWLLAYMTYNYQYRLDLKDRSINIPELNDIEFNDRVAQAISWAKQSFDLNNNVCASNLLGVIAYTEGPKVIEKYNLSSPKEYFEYAAEHGYIFAYNNLSNIDKDNIFIDPENVESYLASYINNLKKAADHYCNWSANQLGLFYLTGKLSHKNGNEKSFSNYIDKNKAKYYFLKAYKYEYDAATAWALFNLLYNYKEDFTDEEKEEYITSIIRLKNKEALVKLKEKLPELNKLISICETKCP